ncbi:hypothetical protein GGX14DRAFT_347552, partial [Mycena pura]
IDQGWVYDNTKLLFWLPNQHRVGFWMPLNTAVISRQQTLLSYSNFVHGMEWTQCYQAAAVGSRGSESRHD